MDDQNRARSGYSYHGEDRRQNVLPSISSRLHFNINTTDDQSNVRQTSPESPHYVQAGGITHAAYDPVHDAYDLPRHATTQGGDFHGAFPTDAYHRGDRPAVPSYNTSRRFDDTTLAPIQPHHHGHLTHSPVHETQAASFRSSARTQSPSHGLHSFQVHTQPEAGSSSSSALPHGTTHPAHAEGETAPYMTLPPLSMPAQASATSSGEGKGGAKRIVMACHQCRGRKIRCDATRPACSNCVRRREECRYDAKPKRRGPDKVPGSRMRSCKSRKQAFEGASPSSGA